MNESKPKDFAIPSFKQFDGKSDPVDHIFNFQQKMALETRNEAILCKVFSTTLVGPALAWFRVLESREKLGRKVAPISVEKEIPMQNKRNFQHSSRSWNKRQKNDRGDYNRQPKQNFRAKVPHFELNTSLERIFMENKDKNIFRPSATMMISESMRNKSRYCAHHEDFGHMTNDCKNLYGQVMHTIREGGL